MKKHTKVSPKWIASTQWTIIAVNTGSKIFSRISETISHAIRTLSLKLDLKTFHLFIDNIYKTRSMSLSLLKT